MSAVGRDAADARGPRVRGWCPGAWVPMASGDGLVVRVRPRLARLTAAQVIGLCAVAERFGSGVVDLTNRANVQIRGVAEERHAAVLEALAALGLLDEDPAAERRRNLLVAPDWVAGDRTWRLAEELARRLGELPELPAKFGFAVDAGAERRLAEDPADIRLECGVDGGLVVRADGAETGRAVDEAEAVDRAVELAHWFAGVRSGGAGSGGVNPALRTAARPETRMARLLKRVALPEGWGGAVPVGRGLPRRAGGGAPGVMIGFAFGQVRAGALARIVEDSGASAVRVTPWRCLLLEGSRAVEHPDAIRDPGDPLLTADACPGAPLCPAASVETRDLARRLASQLAGTGRSLHVSGCAKGCARARPADLTLVGREGTFDLVESGHAWDEPCQRGLTPDALLTGI